MFIELYLGGEMSCVKVREGHCFPPRGGKSFSQLRSNFPFSGAEERARELEPEQLVAVGGAGVDHPGLQTAHGVGEGGAVGKGCAGYLQRNPGGERHGTGNDQQGAAGAQVQGGGKLEKFLALRVMATDENRNRQWQSFPHSTLFCCSPAGHALPWILYAKHLSLAP